jgi:hypothetical protein
VPGITQPTSEALVKAMAKSPADRFQTYDEFSMALHAARSHLLLGQLRMQRAATVKAGEAKSWWKKVSG